MGHTHFNGGSHIQLDHVNVGISQLNYTVESITLPDGPFVIYTPQ